MMDIKFCTCDALPGNAYLVWSDEYLAVYRDRNGVQYVAEAESLSDAVPSDAVLYEGEYVKVFRLHGYEVVATRCGVGDGDTVAMEFSMHIEGIYARVTVDIPGDTETIDRVWLGIGLDTAASVAAGIIGEIA